VEEKIKDLWRLYTVQFARPYCKHCKIFYGKQSIGIILNCTKCGRPLILKSFNPIPSIIGGLAIILIAFFTLILIEIPIIWIGGFILGPSLIINAIKQWYSVNKLDKAKYF
jgi:hypothetical protein